MKLSRKVITIIAIKPSLPKVKLQLPKPNQGSVSANQEPSNNQHKANQLWGSNVKDPRAREQIKL